MCFENLNMKKGFSEDFLSTFSFYLMSFLLFCRDIFIILWQIGCRLKWYRRICLTLFGSEPVGLQCGWPSKLEPWTFTTVRKKAASSCTSIPSCATPISFSYTKNTLLNISDYIIRKSPELASGLCNPEVFL